ncbi:hypothetical protein ACFX1X_008222 [Malus domestica]
MDLRINCKSVSTALDALFFKTDSGSSDSSLDEVMSTKRPKAGVGSTEATDGAESIEATDGARRELDGSSELSSSEDFAWLLERAKSFFGAV